MPVAALIFIGPGIEVKPVKRDSLRPDRNHGKKRTNLAIETILVHAEIGGRVAQPNEARQEQRGLGKRPFSPCRRSTGEGMFDHRRPN